MIKNRKELLEFEKKLIKLKEALLKQRDFTREILLKPQGESAGESSSYRTHVGDIGSEAYQREIISQVTTYETKILMEIDLALKKIRERKYGDCERCNKPISKTRLKALPYTRTCIKCQKELSNR
ncbi:MAG: TraR/DksA family transcriptional regulator [candidate division WOR-3 bacterium]|nr:TraR/DksA family transcriptional regulator [candidate division WOR-3 bacterium]